MQPPLTCADVRELIANELDRELTAPMHRRVQEHLAACEACRREYATLAQSLVRVQGVPPPEAASDWFAKRTLGRLLGEIEPGEEPAGAAGQLELWKSG